MQERHKAASHAFVKNISGTPELIILLINNLCNTVVTTVQDFRREVDEKRALLSC
jgi:hypothetical protein